MIGDWDNTNIVDGSVLAPNAWSKGNGLVDQNTGEMPGHPDGSLDATFTNMAVGFGFVNNSNDGFIKFGGDNDLVALNYTPTYTNTSKFTIEMKLKYTQTGTSQRFYSQEDDTSNFIIFFFTNADAVFVRIRKAGVTKDIISSTTMTDGADQTVHIEKDGATIKIYIDDVEVSYTTQDAYNLGNFTLTDGVDIGARNDGAAPMTANMYWYAIYDDAISGARRTVNVGLDNAMGLIGTNVGDVMSLAQLSVETPTITPNGRVFITSIELTLATTTSGATIHFTLDGNDPTISSSVYTVPFSITINTCVKAFAVKSGFADSAIVSEIYREGVAGVALPGQVQDLKIDADIPKKTIGVLVT